MSEDLWTPQWLIQLKDSIMNNEDFQEVKHHLQIDLMGNRQIEEEDYLGETFLRSWKFTRNSVLNSLNENRLSESTVANVSGSGSGNLSQISFNPSDHLPVEDEKFDNSPPDPKISRSDYIEFRDCVSLRSISSNIDPHDYDLNGQINMDKVDKKCLTWWGIRPDPYLVDEIIQHQRRLDRLDVEEQIHIDDNIGITNTTDNQNSMPYNNYNNEYITSDQHVISHNPSSAINNPYENTGQNDDYYNQMNHSSQPIMPHDSNIPLVQHDLPTNQFVDPQPVHHHVGDPHRPHYGFDAQDRQWWRGGRTGGREGPGRWRGGPSRGVGGEYYAPEGWRGRGRFRGRGSYDGGGRRISPRAPQAYGHPGRGYHGSDYDDEYYDPGADADWREPRGRGDAGYHRGWEGDGQVGEWRDGEGIRDRQEQYYRGADNNYDDGRYQHSQGWRDRQGSYKGELPLGDEADASRSSIEAEHSDGARALTSRQLNIKPPIASPSTSLASAVLTGGASVPVAVATAGPGGPPVRSHTNPQQQQQLSKEVLIPTICVSGVIGRGGSVVQEIRKRFHVGVNVEKEDIPSVTTSDNTNETSLPTTGAASGQMMRRVTVMGSDFSAIEAACKHILELSKDIQMNLKEKLLLAAPPPITNHNSSYSHTNGSPYPHHHQQAVNSYPTSKPTGNGFRSEGYSSYYDQEGRVAVGVKRGREHFNSQEHPSHRGHYKEPATANNDSFANDHTTYDHRCARR